MNLKVKNETKGQRGFYVNGELVFVDAGQTGTFTGASKSDADTAVAVPGLKVWADDKPLFEEKPATDRPWLVIARDASGTDMKVVELDGRWLVGTAVASERPKGAEGYAFTTIGGGMEAVVTPAPVEPVVEPEAEPEPNGVISADELVAGNAAGVIAAIADADADRVSAISAAENAREGGPRKGVLRAIEERQIDPFGG